MRGSWVERGRLLTVALACAALVTTGCGNRALDELEGAAAVSSGPSGTPPAPDETMSAPAASDTGGLVEATPSGSGSAPSARTGGQVTRSASGTAAGSSAPQAASAGARNQASATGPAPAGKDQAPAPAEPSGTERAPDGPVAAGAAAGNLPGAGKTLLIGGLFHRTGPIPLCRTTFEAVSAYLSDLNARGGINGYTFRLIAYDDGSEATRNAALMKQLLERDRVLTVLHCADLVAVAGAEVVSKNDATIIGAFGASDVWYSDERWFVSSSFQQPMYPYHALRYAKERFNATKVGLIYLNVPQGQGGARYTRKYAPRLGQRIVYDSAVSPVEPDFTSYVVKLKQAGAEVVIFPGAADAMIRYLKAAEQQNYDAKLIAPLPAYDPVVGKSVGEFVEGRFYTVVNHAAPETSDPERVARYEKTIRRYFPDVVLSTWTIDGWVIGEMFEEAMRRLGDKEPTPQSLREALRTFREWQGTFNPPLTFGPGVNEFPSGCNAIFAGKADGTFVPEGPRFVCTDSY